MSTIHVVKVASGMRKMTANVIAFQSPIPKVYNVLPPPREDLDDVLALLYTGLCKPTADDLQRLPFFIQHNNIIQALEWLKLNHRDYADIEISEANLKQYSKSEIPVFIEYCQHDSNKVSESH